MQFLPDVYVPCEVCGGKRYNREALEIHYRGHSIADVLEMTTEEALEVFNAVPSIRTKLQTLVDVGLGYIRLGQPATTLSGGEAQRVKLSTELSRRATGKTVYLLDEPTTGLHFADVEKLLQVLHRLVEQGNTVIVIEHNLDVIKTADWIIDLGPEGGAKGGRIVAAGTPEEIAATPDSATGEYLARILRGEPLIPLTHVTFAEAAGRTDRPIQIPVEASAAVRTSRKRAAPAASR
jgi:excinuclease ABC subunit A